jgi:hypothetical protein
MKVLLAIAIVCGTMCGTSVASPTVVQLFPVRPQDSRTLGIIEGVFVRYRLRTQNNTLQALITIRDEATGAERSYYLSETTTIDGSALRCSTSKNGQVSREAADQFADDLGLCRTLPSNIQSEKTHVVVLFWPFTSRLSGGMAYATDQLLVVGPAKQ